MIICDFCRKKLGLYHKTQSLVMTSDESLLATKIYGDLHLCDTCSDDLITAARIQILDLLGIRNDSSTTEEND